MKTPPQTSTPWAFASENSQQEYCAFLHYTVYARTCKNRIVLYKTCSSKMASLMLHHLLPLCNIVVHVSVESFHADSCDSSHFFECKSGRNKLKFVPVLKRWDEVPTYCNNVFTTPGKEDFPAWIGLHRDGNDWHTGDLYL